jgi:cytochrome c-type biogenesis protein CcmH
MTGLWIAAVVMTAAVLMAVLMPLLRGMKKQPPGRAEYDLAVYKDQLGELERDRDRGLIDEAEAEAARIEIQRRMLATTPKGKKTETAHPPNRAFAAVIGVALAVAAFGFYFVLGSPGVPNQPFAERNITSEIAARESQLERDEVLGLTAKLEQRLKENPGDLNSWVLLGRTYLTISEIDSALAAYRKAMGVSNRRPDVVSSYAEALVLAEDGRVPPEARTLFRETTAADPFNPRARYYLGLGLAQQGKVKEALQAWVDLRALSPEGASWLAAVDQQIASAAQELGLAPWAVKPSAEALALGLTAKTTPGIFSAPAKEPPRRPSAGDVEAASRMSEGDRAEMIRSMVQRLADRLKENPDDADGWRRLARAYEVLGKTEKAEDAVARADALASKTKP